MCHKLSMLKDNRTVSAGVSNGADVVSFCVQMGYIVWGWYLVGYYFGGCLSDYHIDILTDQTLDNF